MKILFRRGDEEVALVRAAEARSMDPPERFSDPHHALSFLRRFFDDPAAIERMRFELFDAHERTDVRRMSEREVLREMAALLARGIVRAVMREVPLAQVYLESDKAKKGEKKTGKGEAKNIPSPIVPPQYPILARRESDQTIDAMLHLTRELEAQLHDNFKRLVPPSLVAPEYVSVASTEGSKVEKAVFDLKAKIEEFLYRGLSAMPEPSLPSEFVSVAANEARGMKSAIDALTDALKKELYDGRAIEMPKPAIAPEFVALATSQAASVEGLIKGMISDLSAQLYAFDSASFRSGNPPSADADGG